jgi:hypothetical protein
MAAILTQKTVKALGIATLVLLTIGGGMLVGQPLYNNIQTQTTELKDAEASIKTLEDAKAALEESKANYPAVEAIDNGLLAQFPELAEVPILLDVITAGAVSTGVNPNAISSMTFGAPVISVPVVAAVAEAPAAEDAAAETPPAEDAAAAADVTTVATSGEFATMEIGLSISGTPTQMQNFLTYLNTMDRAMIITGFSISDGEGGEGTKTLSLTGTVYIYKGIPGPTEILAVPAEDQVVVEG